MELSKKIVLRSNILLYAAFQFVVLTGIAMLVYPGGVPTNYAATRYSFIQNYFSDLGATSTVSGHLNVASMVLFVIALVCVGIALIVFSFNYVAFTSLEGRLVGMGKASVVIATISGLSFIGVASTPWNHFLKYHDRFVEFAFGFLLIYMILMTIMQIANRWPAFYVSINIIYLVILAGYVIVFIILPIIGVSLSRESGVIGQKVAVYSSIIDLGIQAYGIRRRFRGTKPTTAALDSPED